MPELIILCPRCQRQLRVPREMLGRLVRCPSCAMTFTVAAGTDQPQPVLPGQSAAPDPSPEPPPTGLAKTGAWSYSVEEQQRAVAALKIPALCLLVTGVLAVLLNSLIVINSLLAGPDAVRTQVGDIKIEEAQFLLIWTVIVVSSRTCVVLSLLVTLGAIQMLRRRTYVLSVLSSIVAMLLVCPFCCLVGVPFGIWALAVLLRPDVRAAFESVRSATS